MSTMCSFGHFSTSSNNHGLPAGIMEAPCDLDRAGHEEERHGGSHDRPSDPRAVLTTYLTFLEHKIGHLRGILCSTPSPRPQQQHAIVSAELRCIIVQLVSIANDLATGAPAADASPSTPLCDGVVIGSPSLSNPAHELPGSDDSDHADEDEEAEHSPSSGPYEVIQIEKEEILAPHAHACKVCGKGFKRDANLRMHMRGHGDQYKTPTALAKPLSASLAPETTALGPERRFYYSCPYAGCKRNKEHRDFQPLKNPVCVKNHYRRSHCDKSHLCRRCGVKRFSVLADLRTHEKHCGRDRWVCSCGTTFARKDKLFAHVAVFDGHTPALPPPDNDVDDATVHCSIATGIAAIVPGSDELAPAAGEALNVNSIFSDFSVEGSRDDGRGYLSSPVGIDFYGFDGFDLSRAVAMDF